MADRKETPDILGEVLSGGASTSPAPAPESVDRPAAPTARQRKARARKAAAPSRPKQPQWEYMEVIFRDYGGYRPRYVNGEEQPGWKQAPVIHQYLNQLGEQGWELVGVGGQDDREMPAYFKRQKG